MIAGMGARAHGMDAGGAVDMGDGGDAVVAHPRHDVHIGAVLSQIKECRRRLGGGRGGKGAEQFAFLDLVVHLVADRVAARIGQKRARAKRPWAEFGPPLKPGDQPAFGQHAGGPRDQIVFGQDTIMEH